MQSLNSLAVTPTGDELKVGDIFADVQVVSGEIMVAIQRRPPTGRHTDRRDAVVPASRIGRTDGPSILALSLREELRICEHVSGCAVLVSS